MHKQVRFNSKWFMGLLLLLGCSCVSVDMASVPTELSDNKSFTLKGLTMAERTSIFVNVSIGEGVRVDQKYQEQFKASINALVESLSVNMPGVTVVMRKNMDALLKEMAFQQTGMTNQAVKLGKFETPRYMVNAEFTNLLYDSRTERGFGNEYKNILKAEIQLTLIEIETAKYLYNQVVSDTRVERTEGEPAASDTWKLMMSQILNEKISALGRTFIKAVPVKGKVLATRGGRSYALIDLGDDLRIRNGMVFSVLLPYHLPSGRLGYDKIGDLEIVQVLPETAWGQFDGNQEKLLVNLPVRLIALD